MKKQNFYYVEFTDTFAGEANYCWVRRYKVKANTVTGAIRKAAKDMGYSGSMRKAWDSGEQTRYNVRGAAICAFVESWDDSSNYPTAVEI